MRLRLLVLATLAVLAGRARADATPVRCDDLSTAELNVDGLLDDWPKATQLRVGAAPDGQVALRCSWDGSALAIALDIIDDRVVRVQRGRAHQDFVTLSVSAGGQPIVVNAFPGSATAKANIVKSARVVVADSLQPNGFSLELLVPARLIPRFSASTPALDVSVIFHDSDQATGGDDADIPLVMTVELGDRKDLLDDFLRTVRLNKSEVKLDRMANLDPDRRGNERIVAGARVIGILTDQYAFVEVPGDVEKIELLPLGSGFDVVAATVRQGGNGGTRDLLMLWTVWSGQLQPLGQIEIAKRLGGSALTAGYRVVKGRRSPELIVEPRPAVGFTAETWNEEPATDADPIVLPWDAQKGGVAYFLKGKELDHRDLPAPKRKR